MQVTEKQFSGIQVLVGQKKKKEDPKYATQLTFF
jgi:CRISPR/Cas system-associated protein endoribonuclease Cas2